jgi:putative ABC transport system permease protein
MFRAAPLDGDLSDELDCHLEMLVQENKASGMPPAEARRAARIKLGQIEPAKEKYRDRRGISGLETLVQDFRYATRVLGKSPAFTMTAVATLALGIGANSAIFSFVNAILLRPLPYRDPERIVQLKAHDRTKGVDFDAVSYPNYRDWAEQNKVFEQMAAYRYALLNMTGAREPQTLLGLRASAELLPLLGIQPILGRVFVTDEDQPGRDRVVVVSYDMWSSVFGRSRDAIGKSLTLDDEQYTVVGVMPADFNFPASVPVSSMLPSRKISYWIPLGIGAAAAHRDWNMLSVVARLKPGATLASALAEMETIARSLERQYSVEDSGVGVHIETLREQLAGNTRPALLVFMAAISLVLLIACANVANLVAARSTTRQKEIAVRTAIGASRSRILRQLLTESLVLGLLGGGLGAPVAAGSVKLFRVIIPGNLPRLAEVSFDARLLAYTFGISLLTGLVFGLMPAIGVARLNLSGSLKGDGQRSTAGATTVRMRGALVITEVALSAAVLVGAGLMFKSFLRLQQVDPGFQSDNVLTAWTTLNRTRYRQPAEVAAFYEQVLERVQSLPGVESAGTADALPLTSIHPGGPFTIEGRPAEVELDAPFAYRCTVSPDYFRAMGIQLIAGRVFARTDRQGTPAVVMINESAAREYWPGDDPVGKRLSFTIGNTPPTWLDIIGVAGDVRQDGVDLPVIPTIYLPMLQAPNGFAFLVVRTAGRPPGTYPPEGPYSKPAGGERAEQYPQASALAPAIRGAIAAVDSEQPIFSIRTMNDIYGDAIAGRRFNMIVLVAFGALALVLAGVGIYGVMAYTVSHRTREIGLRMALGARHHQVIRLVAGQALELSLAGIGLGLAGSVFLTRFLSGLLFEVRSYDPATIIAVSSILLSLALTASLVPAWRAMRVDPSLALRSQ